MRACMVGLGILGLASPASAAPEADDGPSWIAGGSETDDFLSVVRVLTEDDACTGTVISTDRRWVLTASDCIAEDTPQDGILLTPGFDGEPLRSVQWRVHPGSGRSGPDVAVVELASTFDAASSSVNSEAMGDAWLDLEVAVVGYGETAVGADDGGVQRTSQGRIRALEWGAFQVDGDGAGACAGDRGSPVFAFSGALPVQVGVVVRGHCGTRPDTAVRLDALVPWFGREGVPVELDRLPRFPSHVCALTDDPTEPLPSFSYVTQPAEILCQLGPGIDPEGRSWDWDDGSDLEPVHPVAPGQHTLVGLGTFTPALCVTDDPDDVWAHCESRHRLTTCLAPDASFSVFGEAPELTVRGEPELDACRLGESWQVLDEDGAEVLDAFQPPSAVVLDTPGTYRIVHTLQTQVGDDVAEETVVFSESVTDDELGECGCASPASGGSAWLLVGLGGLLIRRRRDSRPG